MEAHLAQKRNENIDSIELAHIYRGKAYEIYFALLDNLFESAEELKKLQLTDNDKDLLQESEKCYSTLIAKCKELKCELDSFNDCIMRLADSVDPNHTIDF